MSATIIILRNCKQFIIYTSHKKTAVQNEVAFSYYRVRGPNFLAVVFVAAIV